MICGAQQRATWGDWSSVRTRSVFDTYDIVDERDSEEIAEAIDRKMEKQKSQLGRNLPDRDQQQPKGEQQQSVTLQ
jgi:hypothetical protein